MGVSGSWRSRADAWPWRDAALWAAVVAFAVPWLTHASLVVTHFYVDGAYYLDAGWFADILWRSGVALAHPPAKGGMYYQIHVAPTLSLLSLLSEFVPLNRVLWFAVVQGTGFGLLGLALSLAVMRLHALQPRLAAAGWQRPRAGSAIWAALVGIAFAHTGVALSISLYPHYEIAIAGLLLLALVLVADGRPWWGAVPFALALGLREDAGCHAAAILGLLAVWRWWCGWAWRDQVPTLVFLATGLAASAAALAVQAIWFPGPPTLSLIYTGSPPFAHVSWDFLLARLDGLTGKQEILGPMLVISLAAVVARHVPLAIGVVAYLPWLIFNLVAQSESAGGLHVHYPFPFLIGFGWTAIALAMTRDGRFVGARPRAAAGVLGLMLIAGFADSGDALKRMLPGTETLTALQRIPAYERFVARLESPSVDLPCPKVDASVMSLASGGFGPNAWLDRDRACRVRSVLFAETGFQRAEAVAVAARLAAPRAYRVRGTIVIAVFAREAAIPSALRPLLTPLAGIPGR
jgi:hypothetical protein